MNIRSLIETLRNAKTSNNDMKMTIVDGNTVTQTIELLKHVESYNQALSLQCAGRKAWGECSATGPRCIGCPEYRVIGIDHN